MTEPTIPFHPRPATSLSHRLPWQELLRIASFAFVGCTGLFIDVNTFSFGMTFLSPGWARTLALAIGVTWNFIGNSLLTFRVQDFSGLGRRYVNYCASCLIGVGVNWGISMSILQQFPETRSMLWLPLLIGAAAGMGFNYTLCRLWVFQDKTTDINNSEELINGGETVREPRRQAA